MLKKIYAIAIIALSSTSFCAMAQKQIDPNNCRQYKLECKGEMPDCRVQRPENMCEQQTLGCPAQGNQFENIELTVDQQAKLKKLAEKEAKECRQKREKIAKERAKRHEKHDKEIKKILTPTQYQQYMANADNCKPGKHHDNCPAKGNCKEGKHHRKGHKHKKCDMPNSCPDKK